MWEWLVEVCLNPLIDFTFGNSDVEWRTHRVFSQTVACCQRPVPNRADYMAEAYRLLLEVGVRVLTGPVSFKTWLDQNLYFEARL